MGVAPPPPVPGGVIERVRSDMRWQKAARGQFPPGELSFSMRRTREFEREPLPLPVLGASWDIESAIRQHDVECVVITFSNAPHNVLLWLLDQCGQLGIRTLVVPRLFERVPARVSIGDTMLKCRLRPA
mgnify:CR=1 FL=1